MANTPRKTTVNFFTGADIEVNDPDKGGIKPHRQPGADTEEAKKPARKRATKKTAAPAAADSAPADDE